MTTPEHVLAEFKSGKLETFIKYIWAVITLCLQIPWE